MGHANLQRLKMDVVLLASIFAVVAFFITNNNRGALLSLLFYKLLNTE